MFSLFQNHWWALLAISISLAIAVARGMAAFDSHRSRLLDDKAKQAYLAKLATSRYRDFYQTTLDAGLQRLDELFGSRCFSGRGLAICGAISFCYCLFGFIIAWAIGGRGSIGPTPFLPEGWTTQLRMGFTIVLISICGGLFAFSAYPTDVVLFFQRLFRGRTEMRSRTHRVLSWLVILSFALFLFLALRSVVYPILLLATFLLFGLGLTLALIIGGVGAGILAALSSGVHIEGAHRFVFAIAILSAVSFGGSFGTRPVAQLFSRYYRLRFARTVQTKLLVATALPFIVFAIIGAIGGGVFVAGAARTYSALIGPDVDDALMSALGFRSDSAILLAMGMVMGFVGGGFSYRFGPSGVFFGTVCCGLISLAILYKYYSLQSLFGTQTVIGLALLNILLFFMILPMLNAVWDWIAWDVSRLCARVLFKRLTRGIVLSQIVFVLFVEICLLVGFVISVAGTFAIFNNWMINQGATAPLPILELAAETAANPFNSRSIWVSVMLFSTLLPTVAHFMFLSLAIAALLTPEGLRDRLRGQIETATKPEDVTAPAAYFTLIYVIGTLGVVLFVGAGVIIIGALGEPISELLYEIVKWATT